MTRLDGCDERDNLSRDFIAEAMPDDFKYRKGLFQQIVLCVLTQRRLRFLERLFQCINRGVGLGVSQTSEGLQA
ncbi:MAG: hypothetical protein IH977_13725 [Nitrospinae bacterium]|nr:hypothetical protein [Nitrospinota bacterium]